jgi:hypothetical protein
MFEVNDVIYSSTADDSALFLVTSTHITSDSIDCMVIAQVFDERHNLGGTGTFDACELRASHYEKLGTLAISNVPTKSPCVCSIRDLCICGCKCGGI